MAPCEDDYYTILGVNRHASDEEIKKAFRKLARESHPDKNPGDPSAKERFQNLQRAYDTLKDPLERSKYDSDNPYYGLGSGTGYWRTSGGPSRTTRSTTAQRYAGSSTHAPGWTGSAAGFGDGFAQQASRSARTKPEYDTYPEYTSSRKTRSGHTYETGGSSFRASKPTSSYEDLFSHPPKRESAYARTSQRQYTTTPRQSGTSSPRPKSTTGTQGHSGGHSKHTTSNDTPNPGFNLNAYIAEKRAKELAQEQREEEARKKAQEKEEKAQRREEEERRERRRAAAEAKKQQEEENFNSSHRHGYGSANGHATRNATRASAWSYPQDNDEEELMKEVEEAEKKLKEEANAHRGKHSATTRGRKKSPTKHADSKKAEAASPTRPSPRDWWQQGQSAEFTFRAAHMPSHTNSEENFHVFEAIPTEDSSEKSEPEHGEYFEAFDSKEKMSNEYVGRNGPKAHHKPTFSAPKAHEKPQSPFDRKESSPHMFGIFTTSSSPYASEETRRADTGQKKENPGMHGFRFGDGVNPFNYQEAPSPQQERAKPTMPSASTTNTRPNPAMPNTESNTHYTVGNDPPKPTFTRPKSQPDYFSQSSTTSSDTTGATRRDIKQDLLDSLNKININDINWLPTPSESSSSPRKKSIPTFKHKKKGNRARAASTDGKYRSRVTIETDSESDSGKLSGSKNVPRPPPPPPPPQAEDLEPMDTDPDTGIPEPMPEPKQQPQTTYTTTSAVPSRPATVQPTSTLGGGLDEMGGLGAVPPIGRSPADVGLSGWDHFKQNVPFPSQAETKSPKKPAKTNARPQDTVPNKDFLDSHIYQTQQAPAEPPFEIPEPPRVPKTPGVVSLSSYNKFYEGLGPYMTSWNKYEAAVQAMRGELASQGMEISSESSMSLDVGAITKYIQRVRGKDSLLDESFRKARDRHIQALESWVDLRNQVVGMPRG